MLRQTILKVIKKYKVLSSDVNLYSNQTISSRSQFNYHQPSYSQFSHQSSSPYSQPSYDDFSSGYSAGPPQASTSRPLQTDITSGYSTGVPQACTSRPLETTRLEETDVLSPADTEASQSSVHSIF